MNISAPSPSSASLFDHTGRRKYLTGEERLRFLAAAARADRRIRTLCMTLTFTGCRISEALALTPGRIDMDGGLIVFETLKKRRHGVFRAVPVPGELTEALDLVHGIRESRRRNREDSLLWPISRMTAWRQITAVMKAAGIRGPQASPKGLRHGFGVAAIEAGIPLNMLQKWLGHAQLSTTAIYAEAMGEEEMALARRLWQS